MVELYVSGLRWSSCFVSVCMFSLRFLFVCSYVWLMEQMRSVSRVFDVFAHFWDDIVYLVFFYNKKYVIPATSSVNHEHILHRLGIVLLQRPSEIPFRRSVWHLDNFYNISSAEP